MHRPTAVLALLQCVAMFTCHLRSEVPISRRSIIGAPTFAGDRFAQGQRCSVVGYDGQYRRMFKEAAADGGDDCCSACYSSSQPTVQLLARPETPQCRINNDAWWLAVIENTNKNNEMQLQHEMDTKEAWRKFQLISS